MINAADRIAILLGRAIIRAEALQAELDALKAQADKPSPPPPKPAK